MRPRHLLLLLALLCVRLPDVVAEEVRWASNPDKAWATAKQEKRPLLIYVTSAACHWCTEMKTKTFGDPEVAEHINKTFVPVSFKAEDERELSKALEVEVYPTTVIVSVVAGKKPVVLGKMMGYVPPATFRKRLAEVTPKGVQR
jgi:thioredoxin-related protein